MISLLIVEGADKVELFLYVRYGNVGNIYRLMIGKKYINFLRTKH